MKQFNYSVIAALFTLLLVTSCEKDPVPPVYDCRMAKEFKSIGSIPEYMGTDRYYPFFTIDDKTYVFGRTDVFYAYNDLALYEYNSIENQWDIVWYVEETLVGSGHTQQEIEEYELQREVCRNLAALTYNQQMKLASCAFKGKGYYFTEDAVMEFDPQARRWNLNLLFSSNFSTIISTTEGIFQVRYDALSRYDITANRWYEESGIPIRNATDFFTVQDQIYSYEKEGLLGIYTPSSQHWEVIEHGIDFSSYQNYYSPPPIQVPNGTVKTNFVLNNKYYILYDHRYYEYNLATRSTCVILFNEYNYYNGQLNHAFVADNKAFIIDTGSKLLMEFTP